MTSDGAEPGRIALPERGHGSPGGLGRRVLALVIDWALSVAVATLVIRVPWPATGGQSFVPLAVFAAENLLLVSTVGATVGQRLLGLRVGSYGRPTLGPTQVLIRTVLLCLFIPAVLMDRDGRGLHDRAAGTIVVRR